jgi:hypothetical protein
MTIEDGGIGRRWIAAEARVGVLRRWARAWKAALRRQRAIDRTENRLLSDANLKLLTEANHAWKCEREASRERDAARARVRQLEGALEDALMQTNDIGLRQLLEAVLRADDAGLDEKSREALKLLDVLNRAALSTRAETTTKPSDNRSDRQTDVRNLPQTSDGGEP